MSEINEDQRAAKSAFRQARGQMRAELAQRFPLAFMPKGAIKRPLAIGIHEQIAAAWPKVDREMLAAALRDYTRGPKYLCACIEGAERVGLDGVADGVVTVDQAGFAKGLMRRAKKRWPKVIKQIAADTAPQAQAA